MRTCDAGHSLSRSCMVPRASFPGGRGRRAGLFSGCVRTCATGDTSDRKIIEESVPILAVRLEMTFSDCVIFENFRWYSWVSGVWGNAQLVCVVTSVRSCTYVSLKWCPAFKAGTFAGWNFPSAGQKMLLGSSMAGGICVYGSHWSEKWFTVPFVRNLGWNNDPGENSVIRVTY